MPSPTPKAVLEKFDCVRKKKLEYLREYRQRPRVKAQTALRIQSEKHRAYMHAYNRSAAGRESYKRRVLRRVYGIELEQWHAMLIEQAGRCAICREPMTGTREPHVDYDHRTGRVRGLLCHRCNVGLIAFEHPGYAAAAAAYLRKHEGRD